MYKVIIKPLHGSKNPNQSSHPIYSQRWETEDVKVLIHRKLQKELGFL